MSPLMIIPLSVGIIFVLAGVLMNVFPPKKINPFYGYRTSGSMRSQERWAFAQKYAAREMVKCGALLAATSVLGLFFDLNENLAVVIGLSLMIAMIVVLLRRVEKAIANRFQEE